jgi:ABC-type glycerol-3-phosphate transport system substrate-binding protein
MKKLMMILCLLVCLQAAFACALAEAPSAFKAVSYQDYLASVPQAPAKDSVFIRCAESPSGSGFSVIPGFLEVTEDCLLLLENGCVEYTVNIPQNGLYALRLSYAMGEEGSGPFAFGLLVDGSLPFEEARQTVLPRLFRDEGEQRTDARGNDIRRRQMAAAVWQTRWMRDSQGYFTDPLRIYLNTGEHTLTFTSLRDAAVLRSIELTPYESPLPYAEAYEAYVRQEIPIAQNTLVFEAEKALYKSDATLQAFNDRASPSVSPYRGAKIVMNAIGGGSWKDIGQEITWEIDVPEDGLYAVTLKCKQNISAGQPSHRMMLIDGELPFKEAESFAFAYGLRWENLTLADEQGVPYLFHLSGGRHTLTLAVSLGETAAVVRELDRSVYALNEAYRKIIMVTGTVPDIYRDYDLHISMPDVITVFADEAERLDALGGHLTALTGVKGEHAAVIERAAVQLRSFAERPRTIAERLGVFKSNLTGLASLILSLGQQYLTMDTIALGDPAGLPPAEAGFLDRTLHSARVFAASFTEDYNTVGDAGGSGDALTLWISTGRDQAEVIRRLIDERFSHDTGIAMDVKLVPPGVLLSATLANKNPDIVIQLGAADPVNYAMRGALADLTAFDDYPQVAARFVKDAAVPYTYREGIYALPETMSFPLLFYRKDIFHELGLEAPDTWEAFYHVLGELQKNNLEIGLPYTSVANYGYGTLNGGMQSYMMFLYQLGGTLYTPDGRQSNITSREGVEAFRMWTGLYANYQLPLTYDFANRFRLGEMPLAIADYTSFNLLQVIAPEIQGLWGFAPVPGMPGPDGLNRSVPFYSSACAILKNNNDRIPESWEFLKWWTASDTQLAYALEMESRLGPSARYHAANLETLSELPWSRAEYAVISEQLRHVAAVPEVPGGYFTPRHIDNAFRAVVYASDDAHDTLLDYVRFINEELLAKQTEFAD